MTHLSQLVEVHRLAVAGEEPGIAAVIGTAVSRRLLPVSRFAEARDVAAATLSVNPDNPGAHYDLGWTLGVLGDPRGALDHYQDALNGYTAANDAVNRAATLNNIGAVHYAMGDRQAALDHYYQALPILREVGDRAVEATTLNNIGAVHYAMGDRQAALDHYHQALHITKQVDNRAGEATTRYNLAMVLRAGGLFSEVVIHLEMVVELDRQVDHPDLESDTALLEQVRSEQANQT